MYGYIYKTINLINGKVYIGQKKSSVFLEEKYLGSGKHLKRAVLLYGKENFKVEMLDTSETKKELDDKEIYWISYYNATDNTIGYNISNGGNDYRSMSGKNNPMYGRHHSKETREKIAEKQRLTFRRKGVTNSKNPEVGKKISNSLKGHEVTSETRKKLSDFNKTHCWVVKLDNTEQKFVNREELEYYFSNGWEKGKIKKLKKKKIYITNGISNKIIYFEEDIPNGWWKGITYSDTGGFKRNGTHVRCIETGDTFYTSKDAAKAYGLKCGSDIVNVCRGKGKTAAGCHWEIITFEEVDESKNKRGIINEER